MFDPPRVVYRAVDWNGYRIIQGELLSINNGWWKVRFIAIDHQLVEESFSGGKIGAQYPHCTHFWASTRAGAWKGEMDFLTASAVVDNKRILAGGAPYHNIATSHLQGKLDNINNCAEAMLREDTVSI